MTTRNKMLGLSLCALIACVAFGIASRGRARVVTVASGAIARSIVARATVVPMDGVSELRAQLEGSVLRVLVREGDRVSAGQLLAEFDARELELSVLQAAAEVDVLEATLQGLVRGGRSEARRELLAIVRAAEQELALAEDQQTRTSSLRTQGAVSEASAQSALTSTELARARLDASKARFDQVKRSGPADVRAAQHRLEGARARLSAMRLSLAHARIVAPHAGVILARHVDPGDVVRTLNAPILFELAEPANIELRAEVEELQAPYVRVGAGVEITEPGGVRRLGRGQVTRVSPSVSKRAIAGDPSELRADSLVRAVYITLDPNTHLELPLGQRAEVRIALGEAQVLARVPRDALTVENGEASVLVERGPLHERHPVQLGYADGQHVEVRGLPAGARVVLRNEQ